MYLLRHGRRAFMLATSRKWGVLSPLYWEEQLFTALSPIGYSGDHVSEERRTDVVGSRRR